MSNTGGNLSYDGHTSLMHGILEEDFSRETPLQTRRCFGLEPNVGLIVGAIADEHALYELCNGLSGLPNAWSVYEPTDMHLTFSSYIRRMDAPIIGDDLAEEYRRLAVNVNDFASGYTSDDAPMLLHPELMASKDTIVLACTPNYTAHQMSLQLLGSLQTSNPDLLKRSWGGHITIARCRRTLDDHERGITDAWLNGIHIPRLIRLTHLLAGAFVVGNDRFTMNYRTIRPI